MFASSESCSTQWQISFIRLISATESMSPQEISGGGKTVRIGFQYTDASNFYLQIISHSHPSSWYSSFLLERNPMEDRETWTSPNSIFLNSTASSDKTHTHTHTHTHTYTPLSPDDESYFYVALKCLQGFISGSMVKNMPAMRVSYTPWGCQRVRHNSMTEQQQQNGFNILEMI